MDDDDDLIILQRAKKQPKRSIAPIQQEPTTRSTEGHLAERPMKTKDAAPLQTDARPKRSAKDLEKLKAPEISEQRRARKDQLDRDLKGKLDQSKRTMSAQKQARDSRYAATGPPKTAQSRESDRKVERLIEVEQLPKQNDEIKKSPTLKDPNTSRKEEPQPQSPPKVQPEREENDQSLQARFKKPPQAPREIDQAVGDMSMPSDAAQPVPSRTETNGLHAVDRTASRPDLREQDQIKLLAPSDPEVSPETIAVQPEISSRETSDLVRNQQPEVRDHLEEKETALGDLVKIDALSSAKVLANYQSQNAEEKVPLEPFPEQTHGSAIEQIAKEQEHKPIFPSLSRQIQEPIAELPLNPDGEKPSSNHVLQEMSSRLSDLSPLEPVDPQQERGQTTKERLLSSSRLEIEPDGNLDRAESLQASQEIHPPATDPPTADETRPYRVSSEPRTLLHVFPESEIEINTSRELTPLLSNHSVQQDLPEPSINNQHSDLVVPRRIENPNHELGPESQSVVPTDEPTASNLQAQLRLRDDEIQQSEPLRQPERGPDHSQRDSSLPAEPLFGHDSKSESEHIHTLPDDKALLDINPLNFDASAFERTESPHAPAKGSLNETRSSNVLLPAAGQDLGNSPLALDEQISLWDSFIAQSESNLSVLQYDIAQLGSMMANFESEINWLDDTIAALDAVMQRSFDEVEFMPLYVSWVERYLQHDDGYMERISVSAPCDHTWIAVAPGTRWEDAVTIQSRYLNSDYDRDDYS